METKKPSIIFDHTEIYHSLDSQRKKCRCRAWERFTRLSRLQEERWSNEGDNGRAERGGGATRAAMINHIITSHHLCVCVFGCDWQLSSFYIYCWVFKITKVTSSDFIFCPTNSPKHKEAFCSLIIIIIVIIIFTHMQDRVSGCEMKNGSFSSSRLLQIVLRHGDILQPLKKCRVRRSSIFWWDIRRLFSCFCDDWSDYWWWEVRTFSSWSCGDKTRGFPHSNKWFWFWNTVSTWTLNAKKHQVLTY